MKFNKQVFLSSLLRSRRGRPIVYLNRATRIHRPLIGKSVHKKAHAILSASLVKDTTLEGADAHPNRRGAAQLEDASALGGSIVETTSQACEHHSTQIARHTGVPITSLSVSQIFKSIQTVSPYLLPSTFRVFGVIQAFASPEPSSPSDFWDRARKSEETLRGYVQRLLEAAATYLKSTKFTDVMYAMNRIVGATAAFRSSIQGALDDHHISLDVLAEILEGVFTAVVNDLDKIFLNDVPGHARRAEIVDKALDLVAHSLVTLAMHHGIREEVVTTYIRALRPQLQALIVAIGDINEQYPQLHPALVFSVTILLIRELWLLKPLLSLFGFGPAASVKGSIATWLQKNLKEAAKSGPGSSDQSPR